MYESIQVKNNIAMQIFYHMGWKLSVSFFVFGDIVDFIFFEVSEHDDGFLKVAVRI